MVEILHQVEASRVGVPIQAQLGMLPPKLLSLSAGAEATTDQGLNIGLLLTVLGLGSEIRGQHGWVL